MSQPAAEIGKQPVRDTPGAPATTAALAALHLALAGVGTWHMDLSSGRETRDATLNRMLGLPEHETTQPVQDLLDRVHPGDRTRVEDAVRRLVEDDIAYDIECRIVQPDGVVRWIRDRARSLRDASGAMVGLTGVVVDQSDAHARTDELARIEAELDQFAYGASHDLQEPLRMIANYMHLLDSRYGAGLDARAQQYMRFAVEGAVRMQGLVASILEYSRHGRMPSVDEPVPLATVVAEAIEQAQPRIDACAAHIDVGDLPTVRGSAAQLTSVMRHLIVNALTFRRPGQSPRVRITARRDGAAWAIAVHDDGIGIAPEHRERVFEVFKRLHSRDDYPGAGIGLALCRKIVGRHGGRIWIDEPADGGASVLVSLPA
ncbi:MAG: PAS domain-containing protein [Planctomycetes bacterium]|nr:PAS domain-containing protein [Planctomycetota bacterium]